MHLYYSLHVKSTIFLFRYKCIIYILSKNWIQRNVLQVSRAEKNSHSAESRTKQSLE